MLAVLAAEAALAEAGMEAVRALARRAVDVDLAEFELVYRAHDLAIVAGKQIGGEAVVGIVGVGERLIEVVDRHRRDQRAESLLLHNVEVIRLDRENGREKPMAAFELGALRLALDKRGRLLLDRPGFHRLELVHFDGADARANLHVARGVADLELFDLCQESVEELVVDLLVKIHAVVAGAHRAAEEEFRLHSRINRLVDVSVVHDDEGRFAAELEADRLDAFRAERIDLAAPAYAAGPRG